MAFFLVLTSVVLLKAKLNCVNWQLKKYVLFLNFVYLSWYVLHYVDDEDVVFITWQS